MPNSCGGCRSGTRETARPRYGRDEPVGLAGTAAVWEVRWLPPRARSPCFCSTIYSLQRSDRSRPSSLRARIVELIEQLAPAIGFAPTLRLEGLVDTRISKDVADNLLPVLREALSNIARHAKASRADVSVVVDDDWATLTVSDNGIGIPDDGRRSGLANLGARAKSLGGTFVAQSVPEGGAELVWRVPVGDT